MEKKITLYLHFQNTRDIKEIMVKQETTVGSLIKQYAGSDSNRPDYEEDLEVHKENGHEELPKDATLKVLQIADCDHLHFSRCKKVVVSIDYNGGSYSHVYSPANIIGRVRKDAIHYFKIGKGDGEDLELFLDSNSDEPITSDTHIGSLTKYPNCSVHLFLSKKKTFQG